MASIEQLERFACAQYRWLVYRLCRLRQAASGRSLPVVTTACAGQVECKRLVSTNAIDWSVTMQMGGQVHAITHLRRPG